MTFEKDFRGICEIDVKINADIKSAMTETCLDKQRVRQAIQKQRKHYIEDLKPDRPTPDISYYLM